MMSNRIQFQIPQFVDSITRFLNHCSQTRNLDAIKKLHANLLVRGMLFTTIGVQTKLILSYATCLPRNQLNLISFFRTIDPTIALPFNILISEFCKSGSASSALKTFSFMHCNGVPLDSYDLCCTLTAATQCESFSLGKQIHALEVKLGWSSSVFVGSALIDLYAKSSFVSAAAKMFDEMPMRNTVCVNALLLGYSNAKMWGEVLTVARSMPRLDLKYDNYTISAILRSCTGLAAVELGRQVHGYLLRHTDDPQSDVYLQSSLIEMYGKCGFVEKARQVFDVTASLGNPDLVLWTSMLGTYGRNGYYQEVIEMYNEMLTRGIIPDEVTFVTVISACARTGQVKLGLEYFESMKLEYRLNPQEEHYGCLVDLLSRAGELDKAWALVNEMLHKGFVGSSSLWGALLSAGVDCGNIEIATFAAQKGLDLDPENSGICTMLSNLYAKFDMWEEIEHLRESVKRRGLRKNIGASWIELTG